jgi:hypothetical protein
MCQWHAACDVAAVLLLLGPAGGEEEEEGGCTPLLVPLAVATATPTTTSWLP